MGKLFWKFFFGFWLCLIAAALATGSALYLMREKPASSDIAEGPRTQFMLETMQEVLEGKGPLALQDLLERNRLRTGNAVPVFAVSQGGSDILGREIPENIRPRVNALFAGLEQAEPGILKVTAKDQSQWILFIPRPRKPAEPGVEPSDEHAKQLEGRGEGLRGEGTRGEGRRHRDALQPPLPPFPGAGLFAALLASLLFAGVLAYTFSKPLNTLKNAFREAGKGRLGIRISRSGRQRTDEMGELLSGFDLMASEIEARIEQQKALLHDVSHELRSPLARLNLAVGLARQNPAQLDNSLSRIETEAERLDHLIGELLNLSRLESTQSTHSARATHNVIELLGAVVEDARFEAQQQNKHIEFQELLDSWAMPCEPEVLQRAFDNLIRNAVKHTPDGGKIEVVARQSTQGALCIQVLDDGPGVPAELMGKLFTPFFKHGSKAGHGLGLAIARKSIENHGGTLTARQRQPVGMEFELVLPRFL
ncbi:signal transduction histidine kinase [Limnobacter thiooxidans]|uniref:histidine kinase n=1 Tax=Limnobacter thiooxidans TaxID=131080 RepID=A0AA86J9A3_9BURK|nr:signal transduction histidine kinase [Limnobacter thiooxidans]BET27515.1 hypothetical protein RGQ30_30160 [Limnobacter thiooxidans]